MGIARTPVTVLTGPRQVGKTTLVLRQLQPWHANLGKRQVKSPKIGVRDSGLLHHLLGLETAKALLSHPKLGASWEGFAIEQVLATEPFDQAWFWATHQGAEIDLLLRRGVRLLGVECKRADAPKLTASIRIALDDLGLERVAVIYPGAKRYPLGDSVEAVPLKALTTPGSLFIGMRPAHEIHPPQAIDGISSTATSSRCSACRYHVPSALEAGSSASADRSFLWVSGESSVHRRNFPVLAKLTQAIEST